MKGLFYTTILDNVVNAVNRFSDRTAFCINEKHYTYSQLGQCISKIRRKLAKTRYQNSMVGLVINDDLETYASIISLWLEGDCYVPLHPNWPVERCLDICRQVELDLILDSSESSRFENTPVLNTTKLKHGMSCLEPKEGVSDHELAYILFTSGSTGKPKGVQITRHNLASFVDAFFSIYPMDENDKCLQCFDLTFDLSIISYLTPLLKGASVCTVPPEAIKYT